MGFAALFLQSGTVRYGNGLLFWNQPSRLLGDLKPIMTLRFAWTDLGTVQRAFCVRNTTTMPDVAINRRDTHTTDTLYTSIKEAQRQAHGGGGGELCVHVPDTVCQTAAACLIVAVLLVYLDHRSGIEPDGVAFPMFALDPSGFAVVERAFLPLDVTNPRIGTVGVEQLRAVFRFHANQTCGGGTRQPLARESTPSDNIMGVLTQFITDKDSIWDMTFANWIKIYADVNAMNEPIHDQLLAILPEVRGALNNNKPYTTKIEEFREYMYRIH